MNNLPPEIIKAIKDNRKVRAELARRSHRAFFAIYLSNYATHPSAPFHDELFAITERDDNRAAVITAFRGSAKSTILTLSYPLWAIIGKQQKKFVLILANTMHQAQTYMKNIKDELEKDGLLRRDLGPFQEDDDWRSSSIVISNYNARITCMSYGQAIRGLRHQQYRPNLIICDDIEDLESVKTLESRDRTYGWFKGEVLPAGDQNTRVLVVGNLLHDDSLIMRLRKQIQDKQLDADYRAYPFFDGQGKAAWPGKFPDQASINAERRKINDEATWQREYMLTIIPDADRVIQKEWIQYYDGLPDKEPGFTYRSAAVGIDPALSQKDQADYTAMVSAKAYAYQDKLRIYILPHPVNERLTFNAQIERAKEISVKVGGTYKAKLCVEKVAYQGSLTEMLRKQNYPAVDAPTGGADKRTRLMTISPYLENGQVFFPRHGAEILISQLLGFGAERHDDLVDAFTIVIGELSKHARPPDHLPDSNFEDDPDNRPIFASIMDMQF